MSEIYRQYESAAAQCADADGLLELQKKLLLPIIAEEKEAFISAEFGRLQQIMGVEYTDGEESKVFHPLPEELKKRRKHSVRKSARAVACRACDASAPDV